jgi:hypothetical protein
MVGLALEGQRRKMLREVINCLLKLCPVGRSGTMFDHLVRTIKEPPFPGAFEAKQGKA